MAGEKVAKEEENKYPEQRRKVLRVGEGHQKDENGHNERDHEANGDAAGKDKFLI